MEIPKSDFKNAAYYAEMFIEFDRRNKNNIVYFDGKLLEPSGIKLYTPIQILMLSCIEASMKSRRPAKLIWIQGVSFFRTTRQILLPGATFKA